MLWFCKWLNWDREALPSILGATQILSGLTWTRLTPETAFFDEHKYEKKNCKELVCLFVLVTLTSLLSLPNSSPLREDSLLSGWLLGSLLFYRMQIMSEKTEVSMLLLSLLSLSLVTQSCPGLCNSMDCSLLGSSVHGISQARILEWVSISFSRGSSLPKDQTMSPAVASDSLPLSLQESPRGLYRCT